MDLVFKGRPDAEGRQRLRTLPIGVGTAENEDDFVERTTFDDFGNVKSMIDFEGRVTEYVYDYNLATPGALGITGRLIETRYWASEDDVEEDPAERYVYTYDAFGRTTQIEIFAGSTLLQSTANTLDSQGQLTHEVTTEGGQSRKVHYLYYEGSGRVKLIETGEPGPGHGGVYGIDWSKSDDGKGITTTAYRYDQFNRMTGALAAERNDVAVSSSSRPSLIISTALLAYGLDETQYGYDKNGNLDWSFLPDGVTVDYVYDAMNRLSRIEYFIDTNDDCILDWDDSNHDGQWTTGEGERPIASFEYNVDIFGQRTGSREVIYGDTGTRIEESIFEWEYDELGRLLSETYDNVIGDTHDYADTFAYDLVGNRLTKVHDDLIENALDEVFAYDYDDNDRLTETM